MKRLYAWLLRLLGIENIGEESDLTSAGASAEVPPEVIAALDNKNNENAKRLGDTEFQKQAREHAKRLTDFYNRNPRPWRIK